ncbi:hypothetical protein [Brevibacillus choshinensis]|uniref:hypothetical protein n=1 Tax=Brevibacillus choshinensis TaxID=54911 RepID=UPI002E1B09EB|nr:hypothetical protein [Brevibacillus choshinensis]
MHYNKSQRTLNNYWRMKVSVSTRQVIYLERIKESLNAYRNKEQDGESVDLATVIRRFCISGIENALKTGVPSLMKHVSNTYLLNKEKGKKTIEVNIILSSSETRAIEDLVAMSNEFLEDEHLQHGQPLFHLKRDDLIGYFIQTGCEGNKGMGTN